MDQPDDIFGSGMLLSYRETGGEEEKDLVEKGDEILNCAQAFFLAMDQTVPRLSSCGPLNLFPGTNLLSEDCSERAEIENWSETCPVNCCASFLHL